jgi:hypothetical protein
MPRLNNWDITFSHISFLEKALATHKCVEEVERSSDIVFTIDRTKGRTTVVAVLIERYTVSLADVIAVMAEFPSVQCIVTAGDWNRYTKEAKEYGLSHAVGVFNVSEFFGALWVADIVSYAKVDANGIPQYAYRSA